MHGPAQLQMGAKVVLGDRPVHVTIARLWAALSMFEKTKFIWQMLVTGLLPDSKEISETVESLKVRPFQINQLVSS